MESQDQKGIAPKSPAEADETEKETDKMLSIAKTKKTVQVKPHLVPSFGKALFLICGIVNFGFSFGFPTSLSVYFLDWQGSFQESRAYTAAIHATCVGTLNTAAVIPGLLMSRYGDRMTLLLGCCLASLGMVMSSFGTSIPYMVASTGLVFGMGCCMINLPTIPCITSVFTKNQSIYISSLSFGSGVTNTVLPFFYTFLSTEYGWRGSHLITGGLILQTCISSLIITSVGMSSTSENEPEEKLLDTGGDCEKSNRLASEQLCPKLPKAGFLLEGISMTSLHSSTFGSQVLGSRSIKNTSDSCKHSKENINKLSRENGINVVHNGKPVAKHGSITTVSESLTRSDNKDCLVRLKISHPFLFDAMFLIEVLSASFSLSAIYSTIALMMDFTKVKGYADNSVSVFLVFLSFLFSMLGKIFNGLMNLIPAVHSFHLVCCYGLMSSIMLISLIYTEDYITLCAEFAVIGFVLGGLASGYPKCVLDMKTVDNKTYPLALGINNSVLGFFDITLPVLMGYTVDQYHSYTIVLYLYSAVSLGLTILMTVIFYLKYRQEFLCRRPKSDE